jgi:hypothetical protein
MSKKAELRSAMDRLGYLVPDSTKQLLIEYVEKEEDKDAKVQAIELEARNIVRNGEREAKYGPPGSDFTRTAAMWSAILGTEVTPAQMALCMVALKISRLVATPDHHDSMVDGIGYFICMQRIIEGEES